MRPFIQGQMYLWNLNYFLIISKYKTKDGTKKIERKGHSEFAVKNVFSFSKVIIIAQQNCPLNTVLVMSRMLQKEAALSLFIQATEEPVPVMSGRQTTV